MEFEHLKWDYHTKCMQTPKGNSAGAQKQDLKEWSVLQDNTGSFTHSIK